MGSWKVKFSTKKYPQEFQVLKYIRTMSSHHLTATIESISKRFGLEEKMSQKYIKFLINMGEITELEEENEKGFVTDKWFLTKEEKL